MEFSPRHPQPFTIAQAIELDVSIITEEIARLQNSIGHLNDTQQTIQTYLATEGDDELTAALTENEQVIASQRERISMLQFALREKGIAGAEHYSITAPGPTSAQSLPRSQVERPIMADGGSGGGIDL